MVKADEFPNFDEFFKLIAANAKIENHVLWDGHTSNHSPYVKSKSVWTSQSDVVPHRRDAMQGLLLVFKMKLFTHWTPKATRRQMPDWNRVTFVRVTTQLWNVLCLQTWAWQIATIKNKTCGLGDYLLVTAVKYVTLGNVVPPCCMVTVDHNPYSLHASNKVLQI